MEKRRPAYSIFFSFFLLTMLIVLHIYISTEVMFIHASICEISVRGMIPADGPV